jgi:hypothetical protein
MRFRVAPIKGGRVDRMHNPQSLIRTFDIPDKRVSGQTDRTFDVILSCQSPLLTRAYYSEGKL